jgi:hypothetical protein
MKPSPSKTSKAAGGKKRAREEAARSAAGTSPPVSPLRPNPNQEWKKSKAKTEDLLALLNSGFLREKEVDMWRAVAGDPYPLEKSPDEIPMFTRFAERGLSLPASDFFKGLLGYYGIEYLNLNPNGIFHTSVFVHFCEAFLGIKPHWILFRKFFRVKPQPSANNPRVVGGAGIQMREDIAEQYLSYKLIDSNQDWKSKWFYITNHHPELPKPSGKQPKHRRMVELGANNAGRYPVARTVGENQRVERSRAEGRTCGLQLHEAKGAAADGPRQPRVPVHRQRRHVADAR